MAMETRCPDRRDWQTFHALAEAEGWRVPRIESELFNGRWQEQAMVLVDAERFCGLVTAVAHERSGWIGNLIVPPALRGRGYGSRLFRSAVAALRQQGVASIWLTASAQGAPLYAKAGFVVIDRIERWILSPPLDVAVGAQPEEVTGETIGKLDRSAWGESRQPFLDALLPGGQLFACDDSAALLQGDDELQIIGPWYSKNLCPRSNRLLLQGLLAAANPDRELVVDLLASSPLRQLLVDARFEPVGATALMVRGDRSGVKMNEMVALASLGSVG